MNNSTFLQQLMTLPAVWAAQISPDGRWVAFLWYRAHENFDVFLAPTDGSAAPVALTDTPERTLLVSWAADSRAVVVTQDHDGDERASLYRVAIDRPGLMERLTEDRPDYFLRGGSLSPDGQALYYAMNYDAAAGRETEVTSVYRHDLRTGERQVIAQPNKPAYVQPTLNSLGTHVLYNRRDLHPAGFQWWVVDVEVADASVPQDRELLNFSPTSKVFSRWHTDGRRVVFRTDDKGAGRQDYQSVGIIDIDSREIRWLVDDPGRNVEGFAVSPDGLVVIDEVDHATHRASFIDLDTGVETPFPALPGNLLPLGRAADGAWVGRYYSSTWTDDLVRFDLDAREPGDLVSLTRVWERTDLPRESLAEAEAFCWQSVDGLEIRGWLYRARENAKKAIINVHGGPTYHSEDQLDAELQYYAARGYNVLDVNYRGSTGSGVTFREAIKTNGWGSDEQADITTGAWALVQAGLAQPGSVGVTGTSYGGYSAWCQITGITGGADASVIGAAAPVCGMTDLVVDYETTRPDLRPLSEEMMGGSPTENPRRYAERSPIHFVERIRGMLMIVQGAKDSNVTPANVEEVVGRLQEHNIPFEVVVFDDEGHGILRPANQQVLYRRIADFFDEALT